jgi:hypothetical protein
MEIFSVRIEVIRWWINEAKGYTSPKHSLKVKKESMKPTHGSQAPSPSQQGEGLKRTGAGLLYLKFI